MFPFANIDHIHLTPEHVTKHRMQAQRNRDFQRGMDTDERRRSRQNKRLQLIKKQRQQTKSNKRRTLNRNSK